MIKIDEQGYRIVSDNLTGQLLEKSEAPLTTAELIELHNELQVENAALKLYRTEFAATGFPDAFEEAVAGGVEALIPHFHETIDELEKSRERFKLLQTMLEKAEVLRFRDRNFIDIPEIGVLLSQIVCDSGQQELLTSRLRDVLRFITMEFVSAYYTAAVSGAFVNELRSVNVSGKIDFLP